MTNALTLPTAGRSRHFDWEKAKTFYYVANLGSFTEASKFTHKSKDVPELDNIYPDVAYFC